MRFSLYKFTSESDIGFCPEEYSKFKFGSKYLARKFGTELAKAYCESEHFKNSKKDFVVCSSPFINVPNATFALREYFVRELNRSLYLSDKNPCTEIKITRKQSYQVDYGVLSKEERESIMSNDYFYVDANTLKGKTCIFLDDIVITGAHEKRIIQMLNQFNLQDEDNVFLCFAELVSDNSLPQIENWLNYYYVKSLNEVDILAHDVRGFIFNIRIIKYILGSDLYEFKKFIEKQDEYFASTLYSLSIANQYNSMPKYQEKFKFLEKFLKQ